MKKSLLVALALALLSIGAFAQDRSNDESGKHKRGHRPPVEAIEACEDSAVGDVCEFTARRGTESGLCEQKHADKPLACRLERKQRKNE